VCTCARSLEISAREILQFWQIWPRVSWRFLFLFSAKEGFCFSKKRGHTCEEKEKDSRTRVREKGRTCEADRTCEVVHV
jgi:hypothetical protein